VSALLYNRRMAPTLTPDDLLTHARQRIDQGDLRAADNYVAMVLEKYPDRADAWALATVIALRAGNRAECERRLVRSLALDPSQPTALSVRAELRIARQDWQGAEIDYQAALNRQPDDASLFSNLASCQFHSGRFAEAIENYRRATALAPSRAEYWNNLGVLLHECHHYADAQTAYRQALSLNPQLSLAHNNLASLLQLSRQLADAERHFREAIRIAPDYAVAWKNLAALYQQQGHWPAARDAYRQAISHRADYAEALAGLIYVCQQLADWSNIDTDFAALDTALAHDPHARFAPLTYLAMCDDPAAQRTVATRWANGFAGQSLARRPGTQKDRIRLGYVGGDFFSHATSWLTAGLFRNHDRSRFEVYGYDYGPDDVSDIRSQVIAGFDHFERIGGRSPQAMAEQILADGIDILIDLKGWTRDNHADLMAWRPSPIQVHYLAYPGTLGAPWCDYLIADATVAPAGADAHFSEALVRLSGCYQINDNTRELPIAPARATLGLPEEAIVFVCFNQHFKITPAVFQRWMSLLKAVPGSVLWLLAGHVDSQATLRQHAVQLGVEPHRLHFAPPVSQREHLARLACADLALDTLPYNSHTTASDALWAGVPLITCMGQSFAARVGASCLRAVGLEELVTESLDHYLDLARSLARDRERLKRLRQHLVDGRAQFPLFDTARSVKALEAAYLQMWQRHLDGIAPAAIEITS